MVGSAVGSRVGDDVGSLVVGAGLGREVGNGVGLKVVDAVGTTAIYTVHMGTCVCGAKGFFHSVSPW